MLTYNSSENSFYIGEKYLLPKQAVAHFRTTGQANLLARAALVRLTNEIVYDAAAWSHCLKALEAKLEPELDPHQRNGIYHLLTRRRSYLAHAPGAGKTLQAIAGHWIRQALTPEKQTSIVICPPALLANWRREILKWSPQIKSILGFSPGSLTISPVAMNSNSGQVYFDARADFILCPDSLIHQAAARLAQVRSNITAVDEASRFKNNSARRSQALYTRGLIQSARHFVMLDGSPITLGAVDLWAPMFFLDPESIDFMTLQEYCEYFTVAEETRFGVKFSGSKNLPEIKKKFFKRLGHGVREQDLYHPVRLREIVQVGEPSFDIEEFGERGLAELGQMPTLDETGNDSLAEYRRMVGSEKVQPALGYIQAQIRAGRKVLVFAYHREVCERLASALGTVPLYGGTNASVREYELEQFKRGRTKSVVGGIGPMGRGHNIQEADLAVFVEFSWSDEENKQAEKRISRKGNDALVTPCVYLALKDSVDERILTAVLRKQGDFDAVFG